MADIEQQARIALNALDVAIASANGARVSLHLTRARQLRATLASQPQAPAAAVPDGFVLVPITPTEDMIDKAREEKVGGNCYVCSRDYADSDDAERVWAAMLAAAPAPEVSDG
jgi:hypothetical protein